MKYKHTCKGCNREFYGRRNQEFHNLQCKIDFNNEKAANLRKELKDNKIAQKNYMILKEAYEIYRNNPIHHIDILKRGFELKAPTRRCKTPKYGYEVFMANGIGFRIINKDNGQFISIYKEHELANL
ncbi:MAG: hypothetical protein JXB49_02155 [Bacteroidales bacterium]|nr:hypothetical protein [Bacteroidales bacterium]